MWKTTFFAITGDNMLSGSIPTFIRDSPEEVEDCPLFPNPFNRIFKNVDFKKFTKGAAEEGEAMTHLITFNLGKLDKL